MWSHDERKEISDAHANTAMIRCPYCGAFVKKYVKSWYTGGIPCAVLVKYCRLCNQSLTEE